MTIAAAFCNSFKRELLAMSPHTAADVYKIALYASTAVLNKATTAYTAVGEVVAAGYTAGGKALDGFAATLDGDTAVLDWSTDPVWADASITARGALIYNATHGNAAVAVLDFGKDVTNTDGPFTAKLPAPTAAAGLVRIA